MDGFYFNYIKVLLIFASEGFLHQHCWDQTDANIRIPLYWHTISSQCSRLTTGENLEIDANIHIPLYPLSKSIVYCKRQNSYKFEVWLYEGGMHRVEISTKTWALSFSPIILSGPRTSCPAILHIPLWWWPPPLSERLRRVRKGPKQQLTNKVRWPRQIISPSPRRRRPAKVKRALLGLICI